MDKINEEIKKNPSGGFPPIYICNKQNTKKKDTTKIRGFTTDETNILADMESILKKNNNDPKPFIPL